MQKHHVTYLVYYAPNRGLYQQLGEAPCHFVGDSYGASRIVFEITEMEGQDEQACERACRDYIAAHSGHNIRQTSNQHLVALAAGTPAQSRDAYKLIRRAARVSANAEVAANDSGVFYSRDLERLIHEWRFLPATTAEIGPRSWRLIKLTPAYRAIPDIFDDTFALLFGGGAVV
ncbi:MAG: hypothetical protein HZB29_09860 [Nitrospinae bacterium]|nr:hypothetical protein [Nitrospinota bacterium]